MSSISVLPGLKNKSLYFTKRNHAHCLWCGNSKERTMFTPHGSDPT